MICVLNWNTSNTYENCYCQSFRHLHLVKSAIEAYGSIFFWKLLMIVFYWNTIPSTEPKPITFDKKILGLGSPETNSLLALKVKMIHTFDYLYISDIVLFELCYVLRFAIWWQRGRFPPYVAFCIVHTGIGIDFDGLGLVLMSLGDSSKLQNVWAWKETHKFHGFELVSGEHSSSIVLCNAVWQGGDSHPIRPICTVQCSSWWNVLVFWMFWCSLFIAVW